MGYQFCVHDVINKAKARENRGFLTRSTSRTVSLEIKTGVEAKDYSSIAKVQNLKPIETEMLHLQDVMSEVLSISRKMRYREEAMRNTNDSTNRRVVTLAALSVLVV